METTEPEANVTRIMLAVNESSIKGYPHASISSRGAFEWTIQKIVRSNTSGFKLLFLHVQAPHEDGFEDMDSIYAFPEDFKTMKHRDQTRGLHLLEYFVTRCHEIGLGSRKVIQRKLSVEKRRGCSPISLLSGAEDLVLSNGLLLEL
ncbi:hypothetical protein ES319_A07G240000v1 [Gossypium barbadense]|uniref:UspA domain-containing protein n=1 Tax=Gossypium barbadense TaxID=3634 RepID=A0A5J5V7W4_GOSBA|nr:hypothetical protein ES319_A07G240000v1 [Gossypium barbadense]